ncbi:CU044_5270 family protein [Actinomadura sp. ATCC 31491]|uniref:CU044_5270 family protein n=1 Tax=Actinomadura luzonensis TaxID=2805427 RepID=A0ABT0FRQ9_9ACTN|nr:CU044_5270 family protein [Actinomadura luzonensis]MCK2215000.1 CU044_5270 family protein [Actinomadura luzonensis]
MNELDLVRGVYGDPPPPSAAATATARRRMLGQDAPAPVRRRRAWRVPLGLAAAATAAAVAAGVTLTSGGEPARPRPGLTAGPEAPSPRGMMLAAASRAELQPEGRYWYTHQRHAFAALALGRTGGYVVEERDEFFRWTGRSRGDGTSFYGRDLSGKPQTRADADAWRAAGSPSSWRIRSSGLTRTLGSEPGPWQEDDPDAQGGGAFHIAGVGRFTYQELQDLPTGPEALREILCEGSITSADGGSGAPKRCDEPRHVLDHVFFMLADTPVPPKVRAGLMRLITDYPGVQRLGAVTDPLGRAAVALAVSFESVDGRGTIQRQVLFDQRTGELLGSRDIQLKPGRNSQKWQVPGRMLDYWLVVDAGWSDTRPVLPG